MTMHAEHRIGRVAFRVAAPDEDAAREATTLLRARYDNIVLPALEAALEQIDRHGEVIRLGRVEVGLGALDPKDLSERDLFERVASALRMALGAAPGLAAPATPDVFSDFAEFLETGELPWFEPGRALATLAAALGTLDAASMERLVSQIRTRLIRRRTAERLVRQFPAVLVRRVLRALLPAALEGPMTTAFGPDRAVPADQTDMVPEQQVSGLTELIVQLARNDIATTFDERGAEAHSHPELGDLIASFVALGPVAPAPHLAQGVDQSGERPEDLVAGDEPREPANPAADVAGDDLQAFAAPRPVHASGAVILWPFLSHFFDQLDLLDQPGRFRGEEARARAVLLSHHLATGASEAPEPETPLFKLLCGMEFSDPVPRRIELTKVERAEANALLKSIVAHWKRLGTTSIAGLREGFLTRPGLLERDGDTWRLRVESRGIDVLLDGLPWALSRVQTPFMSTPLLVDWG
jgi:hypothetical protein